MSRPSSISLLLAATPAVNSTCRFSLGWSNEWFNSPNYLLRSPQNYRNPNSFNETWQVLTFPAPPCARNRREVSCFLFRNLLTHSQINIMGNQPDVFPHLFSLWFLSRVLVFRPLGKPLPVDPLPTDHPCMRTTLWLAVASEGHGQSHSWSGEPGQSVDWGGEAVKFLTQTDGFVDFKNHKRTSRRPKQYLLHLKEIFHNFFLKC